MNSVWSAVPEWFAHPYGQGDRSVSQEHYGENGDEGLSQRKVEVFPAEQKGMDYEQVNARDFYQMLKSFNQVSDTLG